MKSIPIMCSYVFVSMAYGMMMENVGFAWYYSLLTSLTVYTGATGKFAVKTPDVDIKVNPDRLDLVETRFIEGRRCLVIAVENNVEVNGMPVKMWEEAQN